MTTGSSTSDPLMMSWAAIKRHFETSVATRGRSLQERGAVHDLARTSDGGLVARVRADQLYIVNLDLIANVVSADCTCDEELDCRHGVAVLLQYQADVGKGVPIPTASDYDPRITGAEHRELAGDPDDDDDDDAEHGLAIPGSGLIPPWLLEDDDDDDDELDEEDAPEIVRLVLPDDVRQYLRGLPSETLATILEQVASTRRDVHDQLIDQYQDEQASTEDLLEITQQCIDDIKAPTTFRALATLTRDLERIGTHLRVLADRERVDDVLRLYRELLLAANATIEEYDDDPEDIALFEQVHARLAAPFVALPEVLDRSSLTPPDRLVWLAALHKDDSEDVIGDATLPYWQQERPPEFWNTVADGIRALLDRDPALPAPDGDMEAEYDWHRIATNQLIFALEAAGRVDEVILLLEQDAEQTGDPTVLASRLLQLGDLDGAERWLRRGLESDIAFALLGLSTQREMLGTVFERRGDPLTLAAFYADRFFRLSDVKAYTSLIETARSAGLEEPVRRHALRYLETLQLPWKILRRRDEADLPPWPLPDLSLPEPTMAIPLKAPLAAPLLDILLEEGNVDEALRWYQRARGSSLNIHDELTFLERIVVLLEPADPDRAVSLLMDRARYFLERGHPLLLDDAATMLELAGRIEQRRGQLAAWLSTLSGLRHRHRKQTTVRQHLDNVLAQFPSQ